MFRDPASVLTETLTFLDVEDIDLLGNKKARSYPPIEPEISERLRRFYQPFNEALYMLLGVDYGWQGRSI